MILFKNKKTKKYINGDLNEIVLKNNILINKRMFVFSLPFSLNTIMFLDGYKSKVIVFKCSLSYCLYKCMINILLCKKKCWWILIMGVNKRNCKKSNFVPLGERRNRFLKNIPIINNTILVIYSIYTYFLCSSTYCSR